MFKLLLAGRIGGERRVNDQILKTSLGIIIIGITKESLEGEGLKTRNQEQRKPERSFLFVRLAGKSIVVGSFEGREPVTIVARLVI